MKLAFFPQLFGISLSLLSGLNVFAAATISCESFDVRLDAQGRVDLVERSGVPVPVVGTKGFFLTRDGRDESPLEIFSNGPRLRLRWAQGVEVDLKLSNRGTYLTVEVTKFSNLDRDAVFGFEWELGGGVTGGIQELDYMTERVRTSPGGGRVERGHLWETSPDNPLGGFALYVADSPDQADERLYEIWGRENLPHPAVEGDWTPETARAWVDRWLRELHAGNNTSVLAADAMNEAELYEMVEFAHTHGFRYLWMSCGNWRGQYWLKGDALNSTLNPELFPRGREDLARLNRELEARDMGLKWHTLAGCIAEQSPDFAGRDPHGLLASWGRGTLVEAVDRNAKVLRVRMSDDFVPPAAQQGYGPPLYPRWMRTTSLWINGELVEFDRMQEVGGGVWEFSGCKRGRFDSLAMEQAAGAPVTGLLRTYGQDFVPDVNGPLMPVMAERLAEVMTAGRVRKIVFDGFEDLSSEGTWGRFKYAALVYAQLSYPTQTASSGTMPPAWLEYRFHKVQQALHPNGRVRTVIDHPSRPALGPDELEFALSRFVANGARYFEVTGYDVKGIPFSELKQLGLLPHILKQMARWREASARMTPEQRGQLTRGSSHRTVTYEGGADPFWRLRMDDDRYVVEPVHVLRRPGLDVGWSDIGEIGLNGPWVYLKPGERLEADNPYPDQAPSFTLRVLPAYDRSHPDNVELIAPAKRVGRIGGKDATGTHGDAVDTMSLMAALEPREQQELRRENGVLLLSAANPDDISKEVSRPPNRLEYRPPLDLSLNRGLGFEVVGDGSGSLLVASFGKPRDRQYVVPLDFTGRRYVEIPHGQKSWSDGYWAKPHKWGKFDVVPEVNLWLGRIPANTGTRVAVEKLTALRELPQPLRNPGFRIGDGTLQVQGEIPSGAYLVYDGGDTATVFDANWHSLGERPVERSNWHAPSGPVQVELMTDQAGPLPWIKLRMYVTGAPMTFPISKPEEK